MTKTQPSSVAPSSTQVTTLSSHYLLRNFLPQEFVPQSFFVKYGESAIRYMDPRLLRVVQAIRDYLGEPMSINTWHRHGDRHHSGLRLPGSPYWSVGSAHSFGMAVDAVGAWDVTELRRDIFNGKLLLPEPVRIERNVGWLHVDVMNCTNEPVIGFDP